MKRLLGKDLLVGDVIERWWEPGEDTITKLEPYVGVLRVLEGAQLASFKTCKTGMTIEPGMMFDVLRRGAA